MLRPCRHGRRNFVLCEFTESCKGQRDAYRCHRASEESTAQSPDFRQQHSDDRSHSGCGRWYCNPTPCDTPTLIRSAAPRLVRLTRVPGSIASDVVLTRVSPDGLRLLGFLPAAVRVFFR